MPRRHVDQQVAYLPLTDGFQVLRDGVQVPTGCVLGGWLYNVPRLPNELRKRLLSQLYGLPTLEFTVRC
jgi:hypothetical protein